MTTDNPNGVHLASERGGASKTQNITSTPLNDGDINRVNKDRDQKGKKEKKKCERDRPAKGGDMAPKKNI